MKSTPNLTYNFLDSVVGILIIQRFSTDKMSFSEIKIPSERGNENSGCIAKTFSSERRLCIFVFHNGSGNILKRIERTYAKRKLVALYR